MGARSKIYTVILIVPDEIQSPVIGPMGCFGLDNYNDARIRGWDFDQWGPVKYFHEGTMRKYNFAKYVDNNGVEKHYRTHAPLYSATWSRDYFGWDCNLPNRGDYTVPVYAIAPGRVEKKYDDSGGLYIKHDYDPNDDNIGWVACYLHMTDIDLNENDTVQAGQYLGRIAGRGSSNDLKYGPHLHFAVYPLWFNPNASGDISSVSAFFCSGLRSVDLSIAQIENDYDLNIPSYDIELPMGGEVTISAGIRFRNGDDTNQRECSFNIANPGGGYASNFYASFTWLSSNRAIAIVNGSGRVTPGPDAQPGNRTTVTLDWTFLDQQIFNITIV